MIKKLITYIENTIGISININPLHKKEADKLAMYLTEGYRWYKANLAGRQCLLAEMKERNYFSIAQFEKHFNQVRNILELPVIGIYDQLEAYNRKRMIEKKIAFIVPNKQLYIPEFLIDLKEYGITAPKEQQNLAPVAQLMIVFHILNRNAGKQLENKSFKELAKLLDSNAMAITRAVDNLKFHNLIIINGDKEKYIKFKFTRQELWHNIEQRNLFVTPVLKKVYVDEKPTGLIMLYSNASALPEYSDMNPSRQEYFAIDKNIFYELQKHDLLVNHNEYEGRYCLEVWKYNPEILTKQLLGNTLVVDPLSLYLSLKDTRDERIEMALKQIIEKTIW